MLWDMEKTKADYLPQLMSFGLSLLDLGSLGAHGSYSLFVPKEMVLFSLRGCFHPCSLSPGLGHTASPVGSSPGKPGSYCLASRVLGKMADCSCIS